MAVDDVDGEIPVLVEGSVDTSIPGHYQLDYSATDSSGNSGAITRAVTVLDNPLPAAEVSMPIGPPANFFDGVLVEADYWSETPEILSAGMGFADIVGVDARELTFEVVRDAGGAWNQDYFCKDDTRNYTSTSTQNPVGLAYIQQSPYVEHLQIEGGQHVWPGPEGGSDIDMAQEVWNFVSRFDLNGPVEN